MHQDILREPGIKNRINWGLQYKTDPTNRTVCQMKDTRSEVDSRLNKKHLHITGLKGIQIIFI